MYFVRQAIARLDLLRESSLAPLAPQFWGEQELEVGSKSPRIGGFRGLFGIRARGLVRHSRCLFAAIAGISLLLVLLVILPQPARSTAIAQTPNLLTAQSPSALPAPAVTDADQFDSTLDAQVKLVPKIRQFYGGDGGYRGLVAIFILTIGPLKIIPAFIKLTAHADDKLRRQLALRSFMISTIVVLLSAGFGYKLLVNYNIPLTAILAAGGIVLFLVALKIALSQYGEDEPPVPPPKDPSLKLVIQPLVFPIILTPYGIAVVITMSAVARAIDDNILSLLLTLAVIMGVNLLSMLFAPQILQVLKPQILQVIGLVLGIIQLALGLSLIFSAIELQALVIKELLSL
jgi:multiple antibiotic resistance protein